MGSMAAGAAPSQGFCCSTTRFDREDFERSLAASGEALLASIRGVAVWSTGQDESLAAVSEHEVMHEGQIIRHMYGLGRELPHTWRWA